MKRMFTVALPALLAALLMPAAAFADAAVPSVIERGDGWIWALIIAVIVVAAGVMVFVLRKRKK